MKLPTVTATTTVTATAIAAGFVGIASASSAHADQATDAGTHGLGSQATIVNGDVVQGWTVSDLKPSADAIPYQVQGALWEATASDEALKGSVIPVVLDLDARAANGQTYPVLYQVATPQGVNPGTLAQGQKTTGKLYFDVTGDKPDGVVYNAGGQELASWVQSQLPQHRPGNAITTGAAGGPAATPTPAASTVSAGSHQTPAEHPPAPAQAGSQGTPIPGSQGTTLPANSPAVPAPGAGPLPPTPANAPAPPAPANNPGPPAPEAGPPPPAPVNAPAPPGPVNVPAAPAPANVPAAPAPANVPASPAPGNVPASPAPGNIPGPPAPEAGPPPTAPATKNPSAPGPAGGPAGLAPTSPQGSAGTPMQPTS